MPESEPKPKLIELVAPGAGQGWKAVLKNGKPAVVHEISAPATEAAAAVPRIQRLTEHRHPSLAPVLAWGTDPNGIWVAVEPNEGTPLGTILSRGPLTPPAAAALGAAVLSGVAALHESGIAMGGFGAAAIRVTGNGEVRLSGHPAAAVRGAPSQSDLRADVRSCGMAICAAFGVDPAGAPAPPTIPPGLVVTMRSMASGAMGPAADRAQGALREMASALLAPDRMTAAQSELALRAGGREMPSITPYLPKDTFPPEPAPRPSAPQQTQTTSTYTPPPPDEAPKRPSASYEPPARSTETYPPPPGPPVPPPFVPPPRNEPPPSAPASYEPPPRAAETFPPVAPPSVATPVPTWDAKPAAPAAQPGLETWDTVPSPPSAATPPTAPVAPAAPKPSPSSTWDTFPPAPAPSEAVAPTPAAPLPMPSKPEPSAEAKPSWTAIPTPVWTPTADVAPAETPAPPKPTPPPAAAPPPAAPSYTPPAAPSDTPPAAPSYLAPSPSSTTATSAPAPITVPPPTPARKPPAPRRPTRDQATERPPWLVPAIIAIVVILLLGSVGAIVLSNRGSTNNSIATTSPKTSPKVSPKASASPSAVGLQAVPTYAPSANPPVTSVEFLPDATCTLTSCRVDVEMKYSPPQGGELGYTLKFFDRCKGTTTDLPGRHFTPPTPFVRADPGFENVTLPSAKSAALVAVSTTPAVAASAPILLGAESCS